MSVPIVVRGGILATNGSTLPLDAFSRVRTSGSSVVLTNMNVRASNELVMDYKTSNGGSVTESTTNATVTLSAPQNSAGAVTAVRQSYVYAPYIPAVSKLMTFTGILAAGTVSGVSEGYAYGRIGCFDDDNGLFWEWDYGRAAGRKLAVCMMSKASGVNVVTRVNQADFNTSTLTSIAYADLTGTTGTTGAADFSKYQVMFIDQEWLGGGAVRFGIMVQDTPVVAHVFTNFDALTAPYTPIPNAPIRYEASFLTGGGGTGTATTVEGCAAVNLEVANVESSAPAVPFGWSTPVFTVPSGGAETALCATRARVTGTPYTDGSRAAIRLSNVAALVTTTSDNVILRMYRAFVRGGVANGTVAVTGGATAYANPYSNLAGSASICMVQVAYASAAAAGLSLTNPDRAQVVWVGAASTTSAANTALDIIMGSSIDNVADQYVVTAQSVGGTSSFNIAIVLQWSQES